jgi:hypothetical protein
MFKKILLAAILGAALLYSGTTLAQTPGEQARSLLEADQFTVLDVGNYTPPGGTLDPAHAVAVLAYSPNSPTVAATLGETDAQLRANNAAWAHALAGYSALRAAFPDATRLTIVVIGAYIANTFTTETASFDQFLQSAASQVEFKNIQLANVTRNDLVAGAAQTSAPSPSTSTSTVPPTPVPPTTVPPPPPPTVAPIPPPASATGEDPCRALDPKAAPDKALLWVRSHFLNTMMTFSIGGGEWGTHDFAIPGDEQWHPVEMPPGAYTWTASIPGVGSGGGNRSNYDGGRCYMLDLHS